MALKRFDPGPHKYYISDANGGEIEVPSVTKVLGPLYRGPQAGAATLARASNAGTVVHSLTEEDDARWPDVVPANPDLTYNSAKLKHVGRRLAWLDWRRAAGFIPIHVETALASPDGYAGTIDRIGFLRGGRQAVVDIKSGRMAAYARLQLSGYTRMARQNGLLEREPPARIIVQVGESGRWRAHQFEEHEQDELDWQAAHRLYVRLFSVSWAADADRA